MSAPKWFMIARNEYRIRTSSIRGIRPFFPFLVIGALAVFVLFIAPLIVNLLIDELIAFFLSQIAVAMVQAMLFMFFFVFITLPITYTLRDIKTEQQGIFLSAPIKSSDLLLGEFLGELPLYAILITIITGLFTAVLSPLGIDMAQKAIIVLVFVITLSSALWIGTVIAALLRTKLGRSARGRDIGKAFAVLIAVPLVAIMYAFIGGGILEVLADPETSGMIKTILALFPSTWGADVIIGFISNPGNMTAVWSETLTHFGGLVTFFVAILWIGTRVADRAYSMETTTFTAAKTKPDGAFYKTIRYVGGGKSFGTLLASAFKVYSRRFQNLSWLAYSVCLVAMLNIFFVRPEDPIGVIIMSSFVYAMLAAVVASDVTLRGKETLFIYKKIPSGVGMLIKTRLIQGWLVVLPIVAVVMVVTVFQVPDIPFLSVLAYTGPVLLIAAAFVALALGLYLLMPAYTEKGGEFILNLVIIMQGSIFLFLACLILFGETRGMLVMILLSWLLGMTLLFLGKRHLSRME
ncbi:MAG: hypothetical protein HXS48_18445 [Theionarchaea archaeon]|nr:MAG: hypothetical protein AYK19_16600 [Theionarchaea archaeon DG-70-1]MBU7028920.1 hypothetical protein [Theionarchaea archaeon]